MRSREEVEKVRQEIMRFRELLDIMQGIVQRGERSYEKLFTGLDKAETDGLKEKDRQWKAAEIHVNDLEALSRAVMQMRFDSRDLERAFEELYNIITAEMTGEE